MIKKLIFYFIVLTFISHNLFYFFKILSGKQPEINSKCPLVISLINTPLLFDRETLFFNTQIYNLKYSDKTVSLSRRDIRKGLFSYFDMLYFSHWGKYFHIEGANPKILAHYFCQNNSFMGRLQLNPPESVSRQIYSFKNKLLFEETVECQK